jgi:dTDP-4-dehydrorhamnose 3,5-epimerase
MGNHLVTPTEIPGLVVVQLKLHEDTRGWFKEGWHRAALAEAGLPDLGPVQHNTSFNFHRGTLRGIHAEPWDKFVSVTHGRAHGVWVDLREGDNFGTAVRVDLEPTIAVYVPRGVGNAYQTLEDETTYEYLVNAHWSPEARYVAVNPADPTIAVDWPIPLAESIISEKDQTTPNLDAVTPMPRRRALILGAGGQVGRALIEQFPSAHPVTHEELDLADADAIASWPWENYDVVLNAAAWTGVDAAETDEGRLGAWRANATAPALLAAEARRHDLTLVHFSSDYVYDGTVQVHREDEPLSPLGVYGQSKAAGDLAVMGAPRHYVLRTGWVIGEGHNFVRTMMRLAAQGATPDVVSDQIGRLTFAHELARAADHLLAHRAAYGVYHVSNDGPSQSWAEIARAVFTATGRDAADVRETTTEAWTAAQGDRLVAPRPRHSTLDLTKLRATGFDPTPVAQALEEFVSSEVSVRP